MESVPHNHTVQPHRLFNFSHRLEWSPIESTSVTSPVTSGKALRRRSLSVHCSSWKNSPCSETVRPARVTREGRIKPRRVLTPGTRGRKTAASAVKRRGDAFALWTPTCSRPEGLEPRPGSAGVTWRGVGRCLGNVARVLAAGAAVQGRGLAAWEGAALGSRCYTPGGWGGSDSGQRLYGRGERAWAASDPGSGPERSAPAGPRWAPPSMSSPRVAVWTCSASAG